MKGLLRTVSGILVGIFFCSPVCSAEYKPGELIVKFRSAPGSFSAMAGEGAARPVTVAVDNTESALAELRERADVEYAEPNYIVEAEDVPSDWPYDALLWTETRLPQAWDLIGEGGPGGTPPEVDLRNPASLLAADWINGEPSLMIGDIVQVAETGNLRVITEAKKGGSSCLPKYSAKLLDGQTDKGEKIAWWNAWEFSHVINLAPIHFHKMK